MHEGLMLVGLPETTVKLLMAVSRKTGRTMVDVLGDAVRKHVKENLTEQELQQIDLEIRAEAKAASNRG